MSQIKQIFYLDCTANPKPHKTHCSVYQWVNCSQNYRTPSSPPETCARFAQGHKVLAHLVFLYIFMRNTTR